MVPKRLLKEIRKKRNKVFLVAAHIHLEGDALGSELALASLLARLGKKVIVLNQDATPAEYEFLPGVESIRHTAQRPAYDAAILVDCSDVSRIGKISKTIDKDRLLMNIDHHVSNTNFGDVNWVKPAASSASEMVYELFRELGVKIKKTEALLLYTGILADTGSFKYSTTSARTHQVASDLVGHGLDVYGIYRRLYESMDFDTVKSFAKIIETLRTNKARTVAWITVRNHLIRKFPMLAEETDNLIFFARCVKGVEVAALFKETKRNREVRVNLRSRGRADVNKLAKIFGGGGHKMASGCTLKGRLNDVVKLVVREAGKKAA